MEPELPAADSNSHWYNRATYHVLRYLVWGLFKFWNRISVEGRSNIPDGACVWAPNHRSYIDTPLQSCIPRRLRFMGKESVWNNRFFGWLFTTIGCFPVSRGSADRAALLTALAVLQNGEDPVVAFPEGERKDGPRIFPLFDGAAYLAAKTQVPIVPVGIGGTAAAMPRGAKFLYPKRIHVIIGEPIPPPPLSATGRLSRQEVRTTSERLREEIQELFDRAQIICGTPNVYEPGSEPQTNP
ncbi:MAG: 1-acyl-sn-glycerol-3-phosphate acyltransferase [Acidimicrobiales bacterium]|nr:1-acyl-sn-glycerol-3-phosphate acyltransferase [Acidimicrobiales bacterium]